MGCWRLWMLCGTILGRYVPAWPVTSLQQAASRLPGRPNACLPLVAGEPGRGPRCDLLLLHLPSAESALWPQHCVSQLWMMVLLELCRYQIWTQSCRRVIFPACCAHCPTSRPSRRRCLDTTATRPMQTSPSLITPTGGTSTRICWVRIAFCLLCTARSICLRACHAAALELPYMMCLCVWLCSGQLICKIMSYHHCDNATMSAALNIRLQGSFCCCHVALYMCRGGWAVPAWLGAAVQVPVVQMGGGAHGSAHRPGYVARPH